MHPVQFIENSHCDSKQELFNTIKKQKLTMIKLAAETKLPLVHLEQWNVYTNLGSWFSIPHFLFS